MNKNDKFILTNQKRLSVIAKSITKQMESDQDPALQTLVENISLCQSSLEDYRENNPTRIDELTTFINSSFLKELFPEPEYTYFFDVSHFELRIKSNDFIEAAKKKITQLKALPLKIKSLDILPSQHIRLKVDIKEIPNKDEEIFFTTLKNLIKPIVELDYTDPSIKELLHIENKILKIFARSNSYYEFKNLEYIRFDLIEEFDRGYTVNIRMIQNKKYTFKYFLKPTQKIILFQTNNPKNFIELDIKACVWRGNFE